jgi:hypothetical protein
VEAGALMRRRASRGARARARADALAACRAALRAIFQATPEAWGGARSFAVCRGALHRRLGCAAHLKLKPAGGARELLGTTRSTAVANTMCARVPS